MPMTRRRFLFAGSGTVALGLAGLFLYTYPNKPEPLQAPQNPSKAVEESASVEGKIIHVDEDSILTGYGNGLGNFEYEIYRIDVVGKDDPLILIYPGPQSLIVGDKIRATYTPINGKKISYEEFVDKHTRGLIPGAQRGYVIADGVINTESLEKMK